MQKFMTQDRWVAVACGVIAAALVAALPYQTSSRPIPGVRGFDLLDGAFFPKIAIMLFVLAAIWLFFEGSRRDEQSSAPLGDEQDAKTISRSNFLWALGLSGGLLVYVQLLRPFGYLPSTIVGVALLAWICGQRSILGFLAVSVVYPAAIYYLFMKVLSVPLPQGELWY